MVVYEDVSFLGSIQMNDAFLPCVFWLSVDYYDEFSEDNVWLDLYVCILDSKKLGLKLSGTHLGLIWKLSPKQEENTDFPTSFIEFGHWMQKRQHFKLDFQTIWGHYYNGPLGQKIVEILKM